MRKMLSTSLLVCIIGVLSTLTTAVHATPPMTASGTWGYTVTYMEIIKQADGNTFIYGEEIGTWTGTFVGTSNDVFTVVKHAKQGFMNVQGLVYFDGEVNGESGTLVILFAGKKAGVTPPDLWSGKWVILSGEGGLANLRGQGTWWGPSFNLEYSGKIHFDPD